MVYICKNCHYKVKGEKPDTCPYCDRKGTLEKEPSAEELLRSVNE